MSLPACRAAAVRGVFAAPVPASGCRGDLCCTQRRRCHRPARGGCSGGGGSWVCSSSGGGGRHAARPAGQHAEVCRAAVSGAAAADRRSDAAGGCVRACMRACWSGVKQRADGSISDRKALCRGERGTGAFVDSGAAVATLKQPCAAAALMFAARRGPCCRALPIPCPTASRPPHRSPTCTSRLWRRRSRTQTPSARWRTR